MQGPACYFCAPETQQLLAGEAAMLLHASQGPQQHLCTQLQEKKFKLFGEGTARASRAARAGGAGDG